VSVDTYLKRKNVSKYGVVQHHDVRVLLSPSLWQWAKAVRIDAKRGLFGSSFDVDVEHRHNATCAH
jgi:hypothetical protein